MLTKLTVRNFKRFKEIDIALGSPVVFVGPNNSGKTSAMQALALWDLGIRRWSEKYSGNRKPGGGRGAVINRRDLVAAPVPSARLLWHDREFRLPPSDGKIQNPGRIHIEVTVEGLTSDREWKCGLEFYYANSESFYSRPLRTKQSVPFDRMPIPREAQSVQIAYLTPLSGLAAVETRLDSGAVNVRIGEGRTAEVLRNLCFSICQRDIELWYSLVDHVEKLFGCTLGRPQYIPQRGEISMTYLESGTRLDLSSSGRGLQQTILLLAYMYSNPNSVILLDEPDAHLEILRQRQTYRLITEVASEQGNQIIAATHSEVLLSEAANRDMVIAFLGTPHQIEGRGAQLLKSLKDIAFEDYIQAEQTRWVLYLEGSTDLFILQEFAKLLDHNDAQSALQRPFVQYFGNQRSKSADHFYGLREAVQELRGVALFDRMETKAAEGGVLECLIWKKREIENYFCSVESLESFASYSEDSSESAFSSGDGKSRIKVMKESIQEVENAMRTLGKGSPWDSESKVSDDFLAPLFSRYFEKLGLPNLMRKGSFHKLVRHMPADNISPEVVEKLDSIARVSRAANPNS